MVGWFGIRGLVYAAEVATIIAEFLYVFMVEKIDTGTSLYAPVFIS